MKRIAALPAFFALVALGTASTAFAHHSGAMFDSEKTVTLEGTVSEFQWVNPHCFIQIVVEDGEGKGQEWSLEMSAPLHLMRLGWKRTSLNPGDRIKVTAHPLRNGQRGGNVVTVTDASGHELGATR